jgi:hypothetical protein
MERILKCLGGGKKEETEDEEIAFHLLTDLE